MKYGISLPNFGEVGDPNALVDLACAAESRGWDGFFLWDHILWRQPVPMVDCWVALGAIAARTTRIRIGPLVAALPRRRPWKVARECTTLDWLSGGRLIVGVGLGAPAQEFEPFGESWDVHVRAEKLDEALAILTQAWTGEVHHHGRHFTVEASFRPPPLQQPRIPIWVGGYWPNKAPMRRAARWDGAVPRHRGGSVDGPPRSVTAEEFAACMAFVAELRGGAAFDRVAWGETGPLTPAAAAEHVAGYEAAGATWWIEGTQSALTPLDEAWALVDRGPPVETGAPVGDRPARVRE